MREGGREGGRAGGGGRALGWEGKGRATGRDRAVLSRSYTQRLPYIYTDRYIYIPIAAGRDRAARRRGRGRGGGFLQAGAGARVFEGMRTCQIIYIYITHVSGAIYYNIIYYIYYIILYLYILYRSAFRAVPVLCFARRAVSAVRDARLRVPARALGQLEPYHCNI